MKEVYPGIFSITEKGSFGVIKPPENIYIIAGDDGLIYDAGYGTKKAVNMLIQEIKQIKKIYDERNEAFNLTRIIPSHGHPDHFSGLKLIREQLNIKILLTPKMANRIKDEETFYKSFDDTPEDYLVILNDRKESLGVRIRRKAYRWFYRKGYGVTYINDPDQIIKENSEIIINNEVWKIFQSPGHAIDHISLYNEEKGILFSGDNILRSITTWLGPPGCNVKDYMESVEKIYNLSNLKLILPAHGSPIENPKERIKSILEHRKNRTKQVFDLVKENSQKGITPSGIINALYPKGRKLMNGIARGWICITLLMLEEENQIKRSESYSKNEYAFIPVDWL